ncbi:TonB-dependent receptor domain-containing protein [Aquipseudomonas campi]
MGATIRQDDFDYHGGRDAGYIYRLDPNDLGAFNPPKPTDLNANMWKYNTTQNQAGFCTAGQFSLTDTTTFIVGSRLNWFKTESMAHTTGTPVNREYARNREVTPYAGLVQDLSDNLSAYASYSEIFKPQGNRDINGSILAPMTGSNYELDSRVSSSTNA